jgi:hypothetical protein
MGLSVCGLRKTNGDMDWSTPYECSFEGGGDMEAKLFAQ